eukprot:TRINITY_DN7929_c0_g1_i2.p1 TRINITY_DN7929_c0_g1~~TRINITY_DN7929_c0_g1_i2.p1  ORF type:complete len:500 (+),score=60.20 TRINITY_DN7929_c0_g1_i2:85-1584(+)
MLNISKIHSPPREPDYKQIKEEFDIANKVPSRKFPKVLAVLPSPFNSQLPGIKNARRRNIRPFNKPETEVSERNDDFSKAIQRFSPDCDTERKMCDRRFSARVNTNDISIATLIQNFPTSGSRNRSGSHPYINEQVEDFNLILNQQEESLERLKSYGVREYRNQSLKNTPQIKNGLSKLLDMIPLPKVKLPGIRSAYVDNTQILSEKGRRLALRRERTPREHQAIFRQITAGIPRINHFLLEDMVTLETNGNGIKTVIHAPSLKLYMLMEVPMPSKEKIVRFKDAMTFWDSKFQNSKRLAHINGIYWNNPEGKMTLLIEYFTKGPLANMLEFYESLPENTIKEIAKSLVEALTEMHSQNQTYGEINAHSIMFDDRNTPKLLPPTDPLNATSIFEGSFQLSKSFHFDQEQIYGKYKDIFEFGLLVLTMAIGRLENYGISRMDLRRYCSEYGTKKHHSSACCVLHFLTGKTRTPEPKEEQSTFWEDSKDFESMYSLSLIHI